MTRKKRTLLPSAASLFALFLLFLFVSRPADRSSSKDFTVEYDAQFVEDNSTPSRVGRFDLLDYYREDPELDAAVEAIMERLTEEDMVSQMVITYYSPTWKDAETVIRLIEDNKTGGVIFFEKSNSEIRHLTGVFSTAAKRASSLLLPVYAIDGEPSFMQDRFGGSISLPPAERIPTEEDANKIAGTIALLLRKMGVHINYAPVCDTSFNREIIGLRSFGSDIDKIAALSQAFIESTQANGIVATAKHFPGHGSIEGDTHKKLVFIDGSPPELAVFQRVINAGVLSVMVGHVGVKSNDRYDTDGRPSTLSRNIVTGLLKEELGFKGIVVTDAMTMNAVRSLGMSSYLAARAGCDMILMPSDEEQFIRKMQQEIRGDAGFRSQVTESVRKIVRLKVCLGLINGEVEKI